MIKMYVIELVNKETLSTKYATGHRSSNGLPKLFTLAGAKASMRVNEKYWEKYYKVTPTIREVFFRIGDPA